MKIMFKNLLLEDQIGCGLFAHTETGTGPDAGTGPALKMTTIVLWGRGSVLVGVQCEYFFKM